MGGWLRDSSAASRPLFILETQSDCGGGMGAQTMAYRPLIDFRSFRPWPENGVSLAFKRSRKQRKSIKLGHSFCYRRPRSRSCTICNHRQSTLVPLNFRRKRNAETRDRGYWVRDVSPRVCNPSPRICWDAATLACLQPEVARLRRFAFSDWSREHARFVNCRG